MGVSAKKIELLKRKIIESRARIMRSYPSFGLLLMHLKFVADETLSTVSINAKSVFFNARFFEKLHAGEMDFLLCHLLMHIIKGDIWRLPDFAGDNYHHACDIVNNAFLWQIGCAEERYGHLGKTHYCFGINSTLGCYATPLEVRSTFLINLDTLDERTRRQFLFDSDEKWSTSEPIGKNGVLVLDCDDFYQTEELNPLSLYNLSMNGASTTDSDLGEGSVLLSDKEKWDWRIVNILQSVDDGKGVGDTSLDNILKIKQLQKSQVDWKKILNLFLREEIADYSFAPPDRRFSDYDFFLPDFNEKDFAPADVLFMVDTSGSIDENDLTLAYSEMKGAVEQFGGKLTGKLGFFDSEVHKVVDFYSVKDIVNEAPVGGGGTSFYCVFDYIAERYKTEKPASIVIFTDGCADFPPKENAQGVPVLWLINNELITAPWGKTCQVLQKNNKK